MISTRWPPGARTKARGASQCWVRGSTSWPTIESIAMSGEGRLLWEPSEEAKDNAELTRYMRWLDRGFETYDELWRWSVDDIEGFWASLWDYFDIEGSYEHVLGSREMPGAEWFPGARLNYAEYLLRQARAGETAIVHASELRPLAELSWDELEQQVAAVAHGLRGMGVGKGDRVVAYMPNIAETAVA